MTKHDNFGQFYICHNLSGLGKLVGASDVGRRMSPFRPGVELQEGLLKPRGIGMGIELRRIDGGVSKQFLNHTEVGAMRQ